MHRNEAQGGGLGEGYPSVLAPVPGLTKARFYNKVTPSSTPHFREAFDDIVPVLLRTRCSTTVFYINGTAVCPTRALGG